MATISDHSLTKSGRLSRTVMTVDGRINWDLPSEGGLNGGILVVHFVGEDSGDDESRHAIGVWVSRGRTRSSTDQYDFESDTTGAGQSQFRMTVRNRVLDIGGSRSRRFNEDIGKDEIYARLHLLNVSGEPVFLSGEVRTNTVTGWF